jgi:hypothetical protein
MLHADRNGFFYRAWNAVGVGGLPVEPLTEPTSGAADIWPWPAKLCRDYRGEFCSFNLEANLPSAIFSANAPHWQYPQDDSRNRCLTISAHTSASQPTSRQGITGLGMDARREAVSRYVQNRGQIIAEFIEVESGRKVNRPQLLAAIAECRKRRAVLLIARLDA